MTSWYVRWGSLRSTALEHQQGGLLQQASIVGKRSTIKIFFYGCEIKICIFKPSELKCFTLTTIHLKSVAYNYNELYKQYLMNFTNST